MSNNRNLQNIADYFYIIKTNPIIIGGNSSFIVYDLFTWNISNRSFAPTKMNFVLVSKSGNAYTTSPTCQIGTNDTGVNSTKFNNWVASSAAILDFDSTTSDINTVGQYQLSSNITLLSDSTTSNGIPLLTNGTTVKMNVTSVGTANAFCTIVMYVEGFTYPV